MGLRSVSDNPIVMDWGDTPHDVKQSVRDFVVRNKEILELLSDMEIDHSEFLERIR